MPVSYSLTQIAKMMQASLHGDKCNGIEISWLLTDSRRITFAPATLFFALKTERNDGSRFISELAGKGVKAFVVADLPSDPDLLLQCCFLKTENPLLALQKLAGSHRQLFNLHVTGITGSNGKTIVKEWLGQLLAPHYRVIKSPRSYNSQTGVPLSVWGIDPSHEFAIFEAGISRMGEMEKLEPVIQPDTGIFTNIGPAHNEGFPDIETKIREKLKLFTHCKTLIYSGNHHLLKDKIAQWAIQNPKVSLFTWGEESENHVQIVKMDNKGNETHFVIRYREENFDFKLPFTDKASCENIMHCVSFLALQGMISEPILAAIAHLPPVAMRMELKQGINQCLLINDAYNSDLLSLGVALDFLAAQAPGKKKTVILSDILQSGKDASLLYREVSELLKSKNTSRLIAIGREISKYKDMFDGMETIFYDNTQGFLHQYPELKFYQEGILIKGAREFEFEKISRKLQLKDHETVLEINMDALVHNLNVFRGLLKPGTRIMAMVKAFSYGSGSHEIAGLLQFHGVDYLGVAFADEGVELREHGITLPIVVLNPELHNLDILFRYQLEPEIYSPGLLDRIGRTAADFPGYHAGHPLSVHIKLDTGMHRLGFTPEEIPELIDLLHEYKVLNVVSAFSHLAGSDAAALDSFTQQQIERFTTLSDQLSSALGKPIIRHIANSAAITRHPETHMDMVRLGIGLYGIDTGGTLKGKLQNVTTFKSVISQIKTIPAGESVGYNRAAIVTRETRMAIVPAGYADGLDRRLGNGKTHLLVNGMKAPTLGNISMDMCAIEITGIDAHVGDEVIIFGTEPSVAELAATLQTIPYEIFTSIPPRVKRIYFSE